MMEIDELEKRLNWLDAERQKDKKNIVDLSDTLSSIKDEARKQGSRIKTLETDLKSAISISERVDKYDAVFAEYKTEVLRKLTDLEKKIPVIEKNFDKQRKEDVDSINKRLSEFQTEVKILGDLKKTIQARIEEEFRISQKIDETTKSILELRNVDSEILRQQKTLTSSQFQDEKRVSDLQAEYSLLKKKIEDDRNTRDDHKESVKKLETRISEIVNLEQERRQNQIAFIEKQTLSQVEKDNLWKRWEEKLSNLEGLGNSFNNNIQSLEETQRSIKKALQDLDDVNQRYERRINEITEMNRLNEERFRQEWVSFKVDDQKRWTNYTLTSDEKQREENRQTNKLFDRLTQLEDVSQEVKDSIRAITEENVQQLKGFITLTQELLDSYTQKLGK
jgi:DNA repair exonuclease SbcCD ATPase subunit